MSLELETWNLKLGTIKKTIFFISENQLIRKYFKFFLQKNLHIVEIHNIFVE